MQNPAYSSQNTVSHPGARIRAEVLPKGISVKKAAELIGVGRPALSNLLNGKAALSADMATRLEKAFNYPRKELLEMQARYDAAEATKKIAPLDTKTYVPPFLGIKANQIEQWAAHNISARSRLSVFLRTLVNSTGRAITEVKFPGNDDAERLGWDGFVTADESTPWVPSGRSGWEFGTNEDISSKATGDFNKSVKAHEPEERVQITFIFVTPRRWPGKDKWEEDAKKKRLWKDVRVYDSSTLEEWVEQSPSAQAWFANETRIPTRDVRSLDKCWTDWADVSTPPLSGIFFETAIEAAKRTMLSRLSKPPAEPIVVAADSTEEALAFLAQLFGDRGNDELHAYRDRVIVFDKPGVMPSLALGVRSFIAVAHTREVEREFAPYMKSVHSIVIYPRNAVNTETHVVLEPVDYETFNKALKEMGLSRDETSRLAHESGRSLTVLRRRVATIPAVRKPGWEADVKTAQTLVPFLFVGAWHSENKTDRIGLSLLAGDRSYAELEKECQKIIQLNDAPMWSIGTYRGVISKIDLLYAIASVITADDLKRYFSMARVVLSEDDPVLDLEDDRRWAASIYGKTREFSGAFRKGISETLVLFAVHGRHLFEKRLGIDLEAQAALVVRDLLPSPLTTRILEANDRDLPTYAEAAPDEFLSILERDLKTASPAVLGLLRPTEPSVFGRSPSRTGLLWALEGLSWNPETLPRAVLILARLAQVEINDNWVNKPVHSLKSIFRAWMPQTAANHEVRVGLIKSLKERFPDVAWKICISQFGSQDDVGDYSHKPHWRSDGYGFGEPFPTWEPYLKFAREMVEMALDWEEHTLEMLSDLIDRLHDLHDDWQSRVWGLIEAWAKEKATDADRAAMREKIRVSALSRRAARRGKKDPRIAALASKAKAAYDALEPSDLLNKHAWLFRRTWVEESFDEIEDIEKLDYEKREERIRKLRVDAMREIRDQRGLGELLKLAELGETSWQIGVHASRDLLSQNELQEFLRLVFLRMVENESNDSRFKNLISGAIRVISESDKREQLLKAIAADRSEEDMARLLTLAPFDKDTWKMVDALDEAARAKYWADVVPDVIYHTDAESNEGVERLLKADRPRAAFSCVHLHPEKLDPRILFRLLSEMAKGGSDRPGEYLLHDYYLDEAFKHIDSSTVLTLDQKAGLEFTFVDALVRVGDPGYGIPNLEKYVELHPELFVQAIAWTYKRRDNSPDPVELQVPTNAIENMAERGYKFLKALRRIPGHDQLGELSAERLAKWIQTVRQSCTEIGRSEFADNYLGELLAHAPIGKDGFWPCEPVRQVMEDIQSEQMMRGAHTGVFNSRGAHFRVAGGGEERELADKYRRWGQALQISHPYVSARLLMELARTYEHLATQEVMEDGIRRRLRE